MNRNRAMEDLVILFGLLALCSWIGAAGCKTLEWPWHPSDGTTTTTTTTTSTTSTTVPPVVDPNVPTSISLPDGVVQWADLAEEAKIASCTFDGGTLTMAWLPCTPAMWTGGGDAYCDGCVCGFVPGHDAAYLDYKPDGGDHSWPSIGENIANGHADWEVKSGSTIYFFITGWKNPAQRSDLFKVVVP